jgi:replicative superfamily II helicase
MPDIDIQQLVQKMLSASKGELGNHFKEARDYAAQSYKNILENADLLASKAANGELSEEQAKILLNMHIKAAQNVLLTIEGIGIVAAERAINAAIAVVKDAANALLPISIF